MPDPNKKINYDSIPMRNKTIEKFAKKQDTIYFENDNVAKSKQDMYNLSKTNPSSLKSYGKEKGFTLNNQTYVTSVVDSVVAKYAPNPGSQGPVNKVKKKYKPSHYSSFSEKPNYLKEEKDKPFFYKNK